MTNTFHEEAVKTNEKTSSRQNLKKILFAENLLKKLFLALTLLTFTVSPFLASSACAQTKDHEKAALDLTPLLKKAEAGDAEAQTALGIFFIAGREVEKDEKRGVEWLQKAAEQKDPRGMYYLGLCFLDGIAVKKDEKKGLDLVRQAIQGGYVSAKKFLGESFLSGKYGLTKDVLQAEKLLKEAADEEEPEAQFILGLLYLEGEKEVPANRRRALKWLTLSAAHGCAPAQLCLGKEYLKSENYFWAGEWLEEAEKAGEPEAMFLLAQKDLDGWGHFAPDPASALERLRKAAEKGFAKAQLLYGLFQNELGNEFFGAYAIQSAALQGEKEAQKELKKLNPSAEICEKLGFTFLFGEGAPNALETARFWFQKGADQKSANCCFRLAYMNLNGVGGPKDTEAGIALLKKGSFLGSAKCRSALAWIHFSGKLQPQDFAKVHELLDAPLPSKNESADGNANPEMSESMENLGESLTLKGLCAFFGLGMEKDRARAAHLFQSAAQKNDHFAQAWIAFTTIYPIPEETANPQEVLDRIRKEAEAGNAFAAVLLGMAYERGWIVPLDPKEFYRWSRASAETGCFIGELQTFTAQHLGLGTERNPNEALRWLHAAAAKGSAQARELLILRTTNIWKTAPKN